MTSPNPGIFKSFRAAPGSIAPYRIVTHGVTDGQVVQASGVTDALFGVTQQLGPDGAGRVDICLGGLPEIEIGGPVVRGDWLTSDAEGRAVAAAPDAGETAQVIGRALVSAIAGDIVAFQFAPGQIAG
ncbi:capsid cement protein [Telmatospirillum sp. J64-1]|uniref:capsid cement protein n=1 Tax=Telmatospirillum sp. J64-1 TaxID=2502183 RepID=UPI00115D4B7B|nr:capsid cement protein [Telmatospirillum sp. J64-1]